MRLLHVYFGCLLAALVVPLRAEAHGLGVDTKFVDEGVEVEAYYDDDTPARKAKVRVEDAQRQLVAEGYTDADGRWSFAQPRPGTYRVIVDAGAGHRKAVPLTVAGASEPSTAGDTPHTESRHRAELTRVPWAPIALGLAIIAAVGLAAWGILRGRQPRPGA